MPAAAKGVIARPLRNASTTRQVSLTSAPTRSSQHRRPMYAGVGHVGDVALRLKFGELGPN